MPDGARQSAVYLSIASNITPEKNLQAAVDQLKSLGALGAVSSVYQSPPFGFTAQPDFWDVMVQLNTDLTPITLKSELYRIEHDLGRDRANQQNKYGPLPLDMDILLWGDRAFDFGDKPWHVPDSSITQFAAVAIPLAEIAADVIHPEKGLTIAEIATQFGDVPEIKRLSFQIKQ